MTDRTLTFRADCFFEDGSYVSISLLGGEVIEDILIQVGDLTDWKEPITEIQTDKGIWTRETGFKTWEELQKE